MTKTDKQILPALHNSGKVKDPDLSDIGERNYTSTILKYANLALPIPQLETDNKTVVGAINEINSNVVANPTDEPTDALSSIKIKDTVYSIEGGSSTVVPNPTETPTDTLNSVEIDNTVYGIDTGSEVVANPTETPTGTLNSIGIDGSVYGIDSGSANSLAGLTDTDINNPSNRQYLTYDTESAKWKNKGITDLLTNTTRGKYCSFYSPLNSNLLGCRVYIEPQFTENVTPSPNTSAVFSKYPRFALGYTSNNTHFFSGLYRMYEHEDCTWYAKLGTLDWYYEDGVFKTQGYFFNFPRYHFGCINSRGYTYQGDISNSSRSDKTEGYWDTTSENPQSYLWIRDDQFNGDVSAFTSAIYDDYVIYHSISPSNFPGDSTYDALISAFGYDGWVRKFDWTSIPQFSDGIFGGEWNVISKQLYNIWADKNITTSDQCIKDDVYITYSADDWTRLPKGLGSGGRALCTNFMFEPETLYPEADHFSIYGNQIIFNVSTIGNIWDWMDWLEEHPNFTILYEASDAPYANLSYETIPQVNAGVTQLWASSEGAVEATYYSGDATPYINFTNTVINNAGVGDLGNVNINNAQNNEVLKYDSATQIWVNGPVEVDEIDLSDIADVDLTTPTNGQVLTYDASSDTWINSSISVVEDLSDLSDVTVSSPTSGQILKYNGSAWINSAESTGATTLDELTDVTLTTPANGQVLKYDGSKWVNGADSTVSDLDDLSDVSIATPTSGQILKYNGSTWVNGAETTGATNLDELTDVTLTSPTVGQVLKYDGSKWVNDAGGGSVSDLDDLSDVDITTPTDGQALIYDAANDKWINGAGGGGSSTLSGLNDVTITTPSNNQVLKYDSTAGKWVNGTGGGGGASALNDLSDVAITSATNDDSLVYNSTDSEWQNKPITKSLTQAEYDALVSGGTVDPNIVYFITDGVPSGQMHNYSTTEHIVGTWIDGNPVYEKVCTGTTNQNTSQVLTTGVDKIVSMTGHAGTYALPATYLDNNRKYVIALVGESTHEAKLFTEGSNYNGLTYEVVLRYTKVSS